MPFRRGGCRPQAAEELQSPHLACWQEALISSPGNPPPVCISGRSSVATFFAFLGLLILLFLFFLLFRTTILQSPNQRRHPSSPRNQDLPMPGKHLERVLGCCTPRSLHLEGLRGRTPHQSPQAEAQAFSSLRLFL